jgi:serine/threonine protein kinase
MEMATMNLILAAIPLKTGLIGGIVGSICGIAGGLIGMYFSIKNTKGPRERSFMVKASVVCWIFVSGFVLVVCLAPHSYKPWLFAVYSPVLLGGILFCNKRLGQIRQEESNTSDNAPGKKGFSPDVPVTKNISRQCPQCSAELKPDAPEGLCPACLLQRGIATEGGAPSGALPFTPPPLAELAKLFPQLEILEVIGQGGMGAVYKARQPALDRFVALKILAPKSGGDLDFAGRFEREARALARLSHPNIVGVYDFGVVVGVPPAGEPGVSPGGDPGGKMPPSPSGQRPDATKLHYFLMEFVDGPNLRQVERAGKLSPREALQIIPQICAALQFAHDEGIVHRDIKPENVLLDKKGRVKIADFGLAKILGQEAKDFRLTGARDVMGTPHYMAPEQVEKPQEVDHRADIYSLGVVFYEMLTGELPLGKFDPPSHKVQIDVRLDDVVLRSLAKSPDRRYQHVSEVKTEVETIAGDQGTVKKQKSKFNWAGSLPKMNAPFVERQGARRVFNWSVIGINLLWGLCLICVLLPTMLKGMSFNEKNANLIELLFVAFFVIVLVVRLLRGIISPFMPVPGSSGRESAPSESQSRLILAATVLVIFVAIFLISGGEPFAIFKPAGSNHSHATQNTLVSAPLESDASVNHSSPIAAYRFNPVVEQTVTNGWAIQFSPLRRAPVPASLLTPNSVRDEIGLHGWLARQNMDLAYTGSGNFLGLMKNAVTFTREEWDSFTPAQLLKALGVGGSNMPIKFGESDPASYTYGFRTRENQLVLFQVMDSAGNSGSVKIRYKLVQNGAAVENIPGANMEDAAAAQNIKLRVERMKDVRQFAGAILLFRADNAHQWPETLDQTTNYLDAASKEQLLSKMDAFLYKKPDTNLSESATATSGVLFEKTPIDPSGKIVGFADGHVEFLRNVANPAAQTLSTQEAEQILPPHSVQFASVPLLPALTVYADYVKAELEMSPRVRALPATISYTNDTITYSKLVTQLEAAFRDQAGVVIKRVDANHIYARYCGLEFHWIAEGETNSARESLMMNTDRIPAQFRVMDDVIMDESAIQSADLIVNQPDSKEIVMDLTSYGARRFAELTAPNIGRQLAIVWHGRVLCAPRIVMPNQGSSLQINGNMTDAEAKQLLDALNHREQPKPVLKPTPTVPARMPKPTAEIPLPPGYEEGQATPLPPGY